MQYRTLVVYYKGELLAVLLDIPRTVGTNELLNDYARYGGFNREHLTCSWPQQLDYKDMKSVLDNEPY